MRQLPRAAAWQYRHNLAAGVQAVRSAELLAVLSRADRAYQWVPDKIRGHVGIPEELLFKRKDAQRFHEPLAYQPRPPRSPGPELRADEIDIANAARNKLARQPQMKPGEVRQNGQRGLPSVRFADQAIHGPQ